MSNNILQNHLENIKIVMIQTSHTGNMGAAARAMKVMGLSQLVLVQPKTLPDEQAVAMASNAADVLEKAQITENLNDAIAGCQLVVGTSARHKRTLNWDIQSSRTCAELICSYIHGHQTDAKVAILFGRESSGLTNEELALCQHLIHIPTNPDYSSLNIASAVQILSYECRLAMLTITDTDINSIASNSNDNWVTAGELDGYFEQLKPLLIQVNFLDPENPRYLMPRLRRLYARAGVKRSEMNILRGILSALQKHK